MILRWAVRTRGGLDARVYAHNRLHVVRVLRANGHGISRFSAALACEAGCWHEHVGLVLPDWDGANMEDKRKSGIGS